jgi:hypothetical protein
MNSIFGAVHEAELMCKKSPFSHKKSIFRCFGTDLEEKGTKDEGRFAELLYICSGILRIPSVYQQIRTSADP